MIGWVICVEDFLAKDKATKLIKGSREKAEAKRDALQIKYNDLEKDRFKVSVSAPVSEIDLEKRMQVKFTLPAEVDSEILLRLLSEVDPFLVGESNDEEGKDNVIEINSNQILEMKLLVNKFNASTEGDPIEVQLVGSEEVAKPCDHKFIRAQTSGDPPGPKICIRCGTPAMLIDC